MGHDLSAMGTNVESANRGIKAFQTTTKGKPGDFALRKFGIPDFVAVVVPTLVSYYVADYAKIQPIIGIFFGLMVGALLLSRRWR